MCNKELEIIQKMKTGDYSQSYDLLILNRGFLRNLYNKLHIYGYYFDEFMSLSYEALIKAVNNVDASKLTYFNSYWKKYILHEYLLEKLRVQYQFSVHVYDYQKSRDTGVDMYADFIDRTSSIGLVSYDNFEEIYDNELRRMLWYEIRNTLSDTNSYIIWEIYYHNKTMVTLAKELGIGPERVRRRKVRSLEKLRRNPTIQQIAKDYFNMNVI